MQRDSNRVFSDIIDLVHPENRAQGVNCLHKRKDMRRNKIMHMEHHGLHKSLEMLPDQIVFVLHHIHCSDGQDCEPIKICGLQLNNKEILIRLSPCRVKDMPNILDDSEENCVKKFHWCITIRIQTYSSDY
jgi:hypothetical protein